MSQKGAGLAGYKMAAVLTRSLAHQIRTPLAVLSNDLYYFATRLGDEECRRSQAQCRKISETLSAVTCFFSETLTAEMVELEQLLSDVFEGLENKTGRKAAIIGDAARLKLAFKALKELTLAPDFPPRAVLSEYAEAYLLVIEVRQIHGPRSRAESLSSFFHDSAQFNSFLPALVDCIFFASGFTLQIDGRPEGCSIRIEIPGARI